MKKIILSLLLGCILGFSAQAQNKPYFQNSIEFGTGGLFLLDEELGGALTILNFEYIAGARMDQHVFLGGGTGFETSINGLTIPIYANFKYYFSNSENSKISPFVSSSVGMNISGMDCPEYAEIGYKLNVSGGCNVTLSNNMSIYAMMGLESGMIESTSLLGPQFCVGITF